MNSGTGTSSSFIESLHAILPPARVLHVGVGAGLGTMHLWRNWAVGEAWLIDPGAAGQPWLAALAAEQPAWHIEAATLAARAGPVNFFEASNPAESGLIAPAALQALWPNLQEVASGVHQARTLDALVGQPSAGPHGDWLLIDCLSAYDILQGAQHTLAACSVVWVRTLHTALTDENGSVLAASLGQLQALLAPSGFRCAHLGACTHPAVLEAVFVRDWRGHLQDAQQQAAAAWANEKAALAEHEALQQQKEMQQQQLQEQASLLDERQKRIVQLQQALAEQTEASLQQQQDGSALRASLASLKEQSSAQASACEAEKASLLEQHGASAKAIALLTDERNERAWQAAAAQQRIEELEQKIAEQAQALGLHEADLAAQQQKWEQERQQERQVAQQALAALEASKEALAASGQSLQAELAAQQRATDKLAQEIAVHQKAVASKDSELQHRDEELALVNQRQKQLSEELVRAEAQIDLIKDVLLREQGL